MIKKIVFDNIEYAEEIYLLHLVNKCMNDYISIVMIASVKKTFKIPDLQSRINATYHVTITPPDQEFITLMIQEMCFFNKIKISNSTMIYIRNNIFFKDFLNFTGFKLDLQRLYSTKKLLNIDTVKIAYDNWNRV